MNSWIVELLYLWEKGTTMYIIYNAERFDIFTNQLNQACTENIKTKTLKEGFLK